ncbi:MAG: toxin-antitoxin system HicB family antitoxin [Deltaproteobacteria bacterium]|nr:MAG: toxin-antitoxin system HicB family antitoxin [Deltaproteobacteria bacterium]
MKNTLTYKGYTARIAFDPDDNIFFGRVVGLKDMIGFHGETVSEMIDDFHNAIHHYLAGCEARGERPQKPYSGKLTLRMSPDTHAELAAAAADTGKSLNKWVTDTLEGVIHAR